MNKKQTLAEEVKRKSKTPYQSLAERFRTSTNYIGKIARNERVPSRGKGLKIKKALEELIKK